MLWQAAKITEPSFYSDLQHPTLLSIPTSFSDKQVKLLGEQCLLSTSKNQQPHNEGTKHTANSGACQRSQLRYPQHKGCTRSSCKTLTCQPVTLYACLVVPHNQSNCKQNKPSEVHTSQSLLSFRSHEHFAQTAKRIDQLRLHPTLCLHERLSIICCPVTHVSADFVTFSTSQCTNLQYLGSLVTIVSGYNPHHCRFTHTHTVLDTFSPVV